MKKILNEGLEFFSFLILMSIVGFSFMLYAAFVGVYWLYAKLTGKEHLIL
jgi:hypothetical protein